MNVIAGHQIKINKENLSILNFINLLFFSLSLSHHLAIHFIYTRIHIKPAKRKENS